MSVPQARLIGRKRRHPQFAIERKPQLGTLELTWIG